MTILSPLAKLATTVFPLTRAFVETSISSKLSPAGAISVTVTSNALLVEYPVPVMFFVTVNFPVSFLV